MEATLYKEQKQTRRRKYPKDHTEVVQKTNDIRRQLPAVRQTADWQVAATRVELRIERKSRKQTGEDKIIQEEDRKKSQEEYIDTE